jgi:hypothetical protein
MPKSEPFETDCSCGIAHFSVKLAVFCISNFNYAEVKMCCLESLVKQGLWPASPKRPKSVFTLRLLNTLDALLFEGMNFNSFVGSLPYVNDDLVHRTIYRSLLACYMRFSYLKLKLDLNRS